MELKARFPIYLLLIVATSSFYCFAAPQPLSQANGVAVSTLKPLIAVPAFQGLVANNNGNNHQQTVPLGFGQRNKRDTYKDHLFEDSKAHFKMFPTDVRNADEAVQKLYLLLSMAKPKTTIGVDEYDEEFDNPPIDLVLGKEPGSIRRMGSKKKDAPTFNGEETTGVPIVLYQHRMNKKSVSGPTQVIPEIFLRDAATSSRTQPDPKFMRKLLERISFSRQLRAQNLLLDD